MSFLSFPRSARCLYPKAFHSRQLGQQALRDGEMCPPFLEADGASFEAAGLRPVVAASLRAAFPNTRRPTAMQRKLLRAVTQKRDVLLQDDTGTGKSFAVMLALLNRLPMPKENRLAGQDGEALTGLLIVPHRDLAYQYLHWIHHMTLPEGDTLSSLTKYAQVLVRHVNKPTLQGLPVRMQEAIKSASSDRDLLMHETPHILITTPNALLELIERQPELCRMLTPSAVVVDEVDALLHVPNGNMRQKRRRVPREGLGKHIPDLVRVLDRLYPTPRNEHWRDHEKKASLGQDHAAPSRRPQLIMISATLRSRLRGALFNTFGWMGREDVLKLIRKRSSALPAHRLGRSAVHHVLVVSKTGDIKNIIGARPLQPDDGDATPAEQDVGRKDEEDVIFYDEDDDPELVDGIDKTLSHTPLAFDPAMLEAVAATFALDVPRIALLVLPATAAVRKIIFELQQLGVNAHPLDLVANEASRAHVLSREGDLEDNPVLIVGTLATIRGIDIPDLSHVFMLGVPDGRTGDAYLHVAGRVGRFGRRGRVVTVLEEGCQNAMAIVLSRIGVEPTRLVHFE